MPDSAKFGTLLPCVQHRHGHCTMSGEVLKFGRGESLVKTKEPRKDFASEHNRKFTFRLSSEAKSYGQI